MIWQLDLFPDAPGDLPVREPTLVEQMLPTIKTTRPTKEGPPG